MINWEKVKPESPSAATDLEAIRSLIERMEPGASIFLSGVGVQSPDVLDFLGAAREMKVKMSAGRMRGANDGVRIMRVSASTQLPDDGIEDFIKEKCMVDPRLSELSERLYYVYVSHCKKIGVEPIIALRFGKRITSLGFAYKSKAGKAIRHGLALKNPSQQGETNER